MRALCITCPENRASGDAATAHFHARGVGYGAGRAAADFTVDFLHGIHGDTFGLSTRHVYDKDNPGNGGMIIPPKHVGMCLSHYMAWTVANFLPDDHVLILEDDAEFPVGWQERFDQAMVDVPADFDLLFVGSCCCKGRPTTHVKGEVWDVRWPLCTHAYVVAAKALPVLLATQRKVWAHIDIALFYDSLPRLKVYTLLPSLVGQRGTPLHP